MKYKTFLHYKAIIGVICFAGLLSACNNKESTQQNSTNPTKNIKMLKVAINIDMMPFAYVDSKGNPIGFDVELIDTIAKRHGYQVKFNALPWREMFNSVEKGVNDLAISSISYTPEREGKYLLSNPYVYLPAGILLLKDKTNINSLADLKRLRLGVQKDTIFVDFARKNGVTRVVPQEKVFMNFQDLISGKVDAIISDRQIVQRMAIGHPQYKTKILEYGDVNNKGSYAVAVASKSKPQVIEMFNEGVASMKASGELERLEKKWFEEGGDLKQGKK